MADLTFDDLIPDKAGGGLSFDDLVPKRDDDMLEVPVTVRGLKTGQTRKLSRKDARGFDITDIPQKADDMVRSAANVATLGAADKFAAFMNGGDVEDERKHSAEAWERSPLASTIGAGAGLYGGARLLSAAGRAPGMIGRLFAPAGEAGGLASRVVNGAYQGGAIGGGQHVGTDDRDVPIGEKLSDSALPALEGAAIGGGLPVVGAGLGAAWRWGSPYLSEALGGTRLPGMGGRASGILQNAADADEAGLRNLADQGDLAMPVDAGPSMRALGQGVAITPSPGQTRLVNTLTERNAGRNERLAENLNERFGPYQGDPVDLKQTIDDARTAIHSPQYEEALTNAPPIDAYRPMEQLREDALGMTRGNRQVAENVIEGLQDAQRAPTAELQARRVLNQRGELDDQIVPRSEWLGMSSADRAAQRGLIHARASVDSVAKEIPGVPEIDASAAEYHRLREGVDSGYASLQKGEGAMSPRRFASSLEGVDPGAQRAAVTAGQRAILENVVGTNVNDLAALRSTVGEGTDWNAQKLAMGQGEEAANAFRGDIDRETNWARSYNDIVAGSQTGARLGAKEAIEDTKVVIPDLLSMPTKIPQGIINMLLRAGGAGTRNELADALASQGDARTRLLEAMMGRGELRRGQADAIARLLGDPTLRAAAARQAGQP